MTAPAPSQKSRDSKPLGNLFEDLEDAAPPKLKAEVSENLPVVKKPGSWDSENANGTRCRRLSLPQSYGSDSTI